MEMRVYTLPRPLYQSSPLSRPKMMEMGTFGVRSIFTRERIYPPLVITPPFPTEYNY